MRDCTKQNADSTNQNGGVCPKSMGLKWMKPTIKHCGVCRRARPTPQLPDKTAAAKRPRAFRPGRLAQNEKISYRHLAKRPLLGSLYRDLAKRPFTEILPFEEFLCREILYRDLAYENSDLFRDPIKKRALTEVLL